MYKCKHFKIYELVPPSLYNKFGEKCWQLFDERLLMTLDAMRERFGSCTINDWKWGGIFSHSGLRDETFYGTVEKYLTSRSQHKYGRAADCKFKDYTAQEVRAIILQEKEKFPYISFIETGPLKGGKPMTWVHIDVRNSDLTLWSPVEGVLSEQSVISRGL